MEYMKNNDTIVAISTPLGHGGIGIVRLSGPMAVEIAKDIFKKTGKEDISSGKGRKMYYGTIVHPDNDTVIDEVMLTVMKAPSTYTIEDMVEINCHGGMVPIKETLDLCILKGARLAEPGEFTKRAFLNGRIDLTQAEAVLDIIKAETDEACKVAVDQLKGVFSDEIRSLREKVINILSEIELAIDFSDEDVEFTPIEKIKISLEKVLNNVKEILKTADKGIMLRNGVKAVICGRPNVGKSSLMNALLRHDRVIVTPVAGTTRDIVEESININGIIIRLSDTAGINVTDCQIEQEGIKRSKQKLTESDIVIFMLDMSLNISKEDEEIFDMIKNKDFIIVANKNDLKKALDIDLAKTKFGHKNILEVSMANNTGLEQIEDAIEKAIFSNKPVMPQGPVITKLRHKQALEKVMENVERGLDILKEEYNGELLASDMNEALYQLGLITGETVEDDILDRIFSQFCIGK